MKVPNPLGSGKDIVEARVSIARWNLKEAGYLEHTNQWANLWSDEQKSHQDMHEGKVAFQVEAQ